MSLISAFFILIYISFAAFIVDIGGIGGLTLIKTTLAHWTYMLVRT